MNAPDELLARWATLEAERRGENNAGRLSLSYDSHSDSRDRATELSSVTQTLSLSDSDSGDDSEPGDGFDVETLADLLSAEIPEVAYVVDGLLTRGNAVLFSAREKSGKGLFFIDTAINVATGHKVLGRPVTPGPVLYVALEENRRVIRDRFRGRAGDDAKTAPIFTMTGQALDLTNALHVGRLRRVIEQTGAVLVVIDTLRETHDRDENDSGDMAPIARAVRLMAEQTGACIAVTHHMSRAGHARGSTAIPAGFPDVIEYRADDEPDRLCGLLTGKGRDIIPFAQRIAFDGETMRWRVEESDGAPVITGTERAILDVLNATDDWLSAIEIADRAQKSRGTIRNALSAMRQRPYAPMEVKGDGRDTRYHGIQPRQDG